MNKTTFIFEPQDRMDVKRCNTIIKKARIVNRRIGDIRKIPFESMNETKVVQVLDKCFLELQTMNRIAMTGLNRQYGSCLTRRECDGIVRMTLEDYTDMCEWWLANVQEQLTEFVTSPSSFLSLDKRIVGGWMNELSMKLYRWERKILGTPLDFIL